MDTEKVLQISHLEKSFGTHEVLRDIDFTVNKGEAISIIGPSQYLLPRKRYHGCKNEHPFL